MFIKSVTTAALIAAAALSCSAAQAQSLFAFLNAPAQSQIAPRYEALPAEQDNADAQLDPRLQRQVVAYATNEAPGTIVIDTPNTVLYYVLGGGKAIRYGIGVGRQGFTWSGVQQVARKAEWPDWYPPSDMIARQPYLPRMTAGGPGNPLGARAMYLGSSEYRIHGTNNPATIGKQVSSGCIRLTNEDVTDLYNRVQLGAKVVVLPQTSPAQVAQARAMSSSYAPAPQSKAQRTWASIR
ncbi:MAG: L,D-transpeptidase [Rhizobiales bacterium]|nr:L,D-transpeptidase [Hyphomicrobiales bacterium]